ncbi:glycoside hydrolase family 1 protein [Lactobacillus nasalidis]|nr:glycoside hydrolase family 1 protein [Lactobacillus nasalidis]
MPKGFFWGNSVSSMQTEGAWNIDGKSLSVYDLRPATEKTADWHDAIDEYHRYEEDLDLLKAMNMNMYRIQISWSRVIKDGDGEINPAGLAYYDRLVDGMRQRGIEPMICLYHFDMPAKLAREENGFMSRKVVDDFVSYGEKMLDHFAGRVKYWIVFNEHNLYFTDEAFNIAGYDHGDQSIGDMYQIFHHTMLAHARLSKYAHGKYPDLKFGGMIAYTPVYPATSKPVDVYLARKSNEFLNENLNKLYTTGKYSTEVLAWIKNHGIQADFQAGDADILAGIHTDFLAFSYYRSTTLNADKVPAGEAPNRYLNWGFEHNRFLEESDFGWDIDPLGFRNIITHTYNAYGLPVFPIENGIGCLEKWDGEHEIADDRRIAYHRSHIQAMEDAIFEDGAEVLGYLGWGLIDIPSSHADMEKRYGAVYVNRGNPDLRDMKRVPKKSFYWFKKVFASNGEDLA